jgi:hypothetical protein
VKGNPVILAVIVVVPTNRALTTPMEEMDAILGLALDQATATLETYCGVTVASKLYDWPRAIVIVCTFMLTLVGPVDTLTDIIADLLPSLVVARTVAIPLPFAVIRPDALTMATEAAEVVHVTAVLFDVGGMILAMAWNVFPTDNVILPAFNCMLSTFV